MPSIIDVIENHHTPETAQHDSILVRMVATIEYFLLAKVHAPSVAEDSQLFEEKARRFAELGIGLFGEIEWPYVEEALEEEHKRILPMAKAGLKGVLDGSSGDSKDDSENDLESDSKEDFQRNFQRDSTKSRERDPKPVYILNESSGTGSDSRPDRTLDRKPDARPSKPAMRAQPARGRILSQPAESSSWLGRLFSMCIGSRKKS
jgi:hypothetical protein